MRVSGHPVLGMFVTGVGAVTNIILDAVFVAGLGLCAVLVAREQRVLRAKRPA